jgi:hypothetical protein
MLECEESGGIQSRCPDAYLQVMLGLSFADSRQAVCCFVLCCRSAAEVGVEAGVTAGKARAGVEGEVGALEEGALFSIA